MALLYILIAGFFLWRAIGYFKKAEECRKLGKDAEKLNKMNEARANRDDEFFK